VQSALVLGGGSEIAQATMRTLVSAGCRTVILAGRDPETLERHERELATAGATTVERIHFDATDSETHQATIEKCFASHPDIDLVLIAFGVLGHGAGLDMSPDAAALNVTTNYVGAVSSGLAAAQALRAQGHGTIVVLSSVAGERARRSNFVYGSSKSGLDAFAQGLGDALVGSGVGVLVVRPGFVHSKMTAGLEPAPFATTPQAVADAICNALASGKEIVWVPSVLQWVALVFHHLPRAVWRRVSASR
jgi:decaprenylphospho-beta-D-erythro-pentofuranosid-2-ulose 2-reductase